MNVEINQELVHLADGRPLTEDELNELIKLSADGTIYTQSSEDLDLDPSEKEEDEEDVVESAVTVH